MKMKRRKKLNRKGFTLIELLAVIVILAVIMVIASGSILSSMNESKKKSLLNSAQSAAREFENKYADTVLTSATEIYGVPVSVIMSGTTDKPVNVKFSDVGATFENGAVKTAADDATRKKYLDTLNVNKTDYDLEKSFVAYDGTKFTVCFTATEKGTFNVTAAKSTKDVPYDKSIGVASVTMSDGTMWACSNGDTSWGKGQESSTTPTNP